MILRAPLAPRQTSSGSLFTIRLYLGPNKCNEHRSIMWNGRTNKSVKSIRNWLCHRPKCVERNDASSLQLCGCGRRSWPQSVGLPVTYQWTRQWPAPLWFRWATDVPTRSKTAYASCSLAHQLFTESTLANRPESWSADRDGSWSRGGFLYAGRFGEGELGLGACLVVGEQRHRWGGAGAGVQFKGPLPPALAVASRWNGVGACMRDASLHHAPAGRPAHARTRARTRPARRARGVSDEYRHGLAWLASAGAVAASGWRSSMGGGAASRDGSVSVRRHGPAGTGRSSPWCTDPGSVPIDVVATCWRRAH